MKQATFASLAYAGKKKRSRREKFLAVTLARDVGHNVGQSSAVARQAKKKSG